jgi:AraC-like DNA-binding protein
LRRMLRGDLPGQVSRPCSLSASTSFICPARGVEVNESEDRALAERAIALMTDSLGDASLTTTDIALALGVSRSYLSSTVSSTTGLTLREHLRKARVLWAAALLTDGRLSCKQVAYAVGYTPLTLNRNFKLVVGITPNAFRRRHPQLDEPPCCIRTTK